ncbi:fluoride efflux transporter CrcB [Aquitalea sp. S1-19]|nr:fluoride efflux transporter CrcB [Aquitalea sp. S1-19]
MANLIILIFVGGAFGAMCREFIMLLVPALANGFPLDIFIANMLACFLMGLSSSLYQRVRIHHHVHTMIGTGIMGGMSTFSSFVYGTAEAMKTPGEFAMALGYVAASLLVGFCLLQAGVWLVKKTVD